MTMAPKLTIPPLRRVMEQQQQQQQQTPLHRGKKAAIQLVDEDEDAFENVFDNFLDDVVDVDVDNDEAFPILSTPPRSRRSLSSTGSSSSSSSTTHEQRQSLSSPSTDATATTTLRGNPRVRSVMERIVTNPVVSFLTCGGGGGGGNPNKSDNQEDEEGKKRPGSTTAAAAASFLRFIQGGGSSIPKALSPSAIRGYPNAIVQTMKQFPYQGRIQRLGCGALRDLAVDSWPMKSRVVEAPGSIETILKAMRIHLQDAKLQEIACACLYELVAGDLPAILVEKGVVTAVLTTMDQHAQDEDVLPIACDVLMALTDRDVGAVECLRQRLGGVVLAKLEHSFRGRNAGITLKVGELLRRLYL